MIMHVPCEKFYFAFVGKTIVLFFATKHIHTTSGYFSYENVGCIFFV